MDLIAAAISAQVVENPPAGIVVERKRPPLITGQEQTPEYRARIQRARLLVMSNRCSVPAAAKEVGLPVEGLRKRAHREGWVAEANLMKAGALPIAEVARIAADAVQKAREEHALRALGRAHRLQGELDSLASAGIEEVADLRDLVRSECALDEMLRRNLGLDVPDASNTRIGTVNVLSLGSLSLS